jgi:hypothetical protein
VLAVCVNDLHRHPRELQGILDAGDLLDVLALKSLEADATKR